LIDAAAVKKRKMNTVILFPLVMLISELYSRSPLQT